MESENKGLMAYWMENCCTNCYYNSTCGTCIFEKMMSFYPILSQDLEQGKLAAINSQTLRSKNMSCTVRYTCTLKFAKISKKDLLCTKM